MAEPAFDEIIHAPNRTWARLTAAGREAFAGHLAELQRLATLAAEVT